MNARTVLVFGLTLLSGSAGADDLEDAYTSGYENGKAAGYAEGYAAGTARTTAVSQAGRGILIPGTNFQTMIDDNAIANSEVAISPNSSVAIIPKDALVQMKERLGAEFLTDNKIQLNN